MHINDLPLDLLARVFRYLRKRTFLNRACKTCRRWAAVEAENRQALWQPLVEWYWPVESNSPAFAVMGVCWRARYQLLLAESKQLLIADDPSVRENLAKVNAKYTFFVTLTLGNVTVVSKARLDFDENEYGQAEFEDPDDPTNDELLEMGTQITADAFTEADAATLDFASHAPSVECFVQRKDGKVATLFRLASAKPWRDNAAEGNQHRWVADPEAPPCPGRFFKPEGGWRPAREWDSCVDDNNEASPAWIVHTQDEREVDDDDETCPDDVLHVHFTWSLEDTPSWGMLYFALTRAVPEDSDWFNGFASIPVDEVHKVLRENLVWV